MSNLIEQFQTTTDLNFFLENYPRVFTPDIVNAICKNKKLRPKIEKEVGKINCHYKDKVHNSFVEYLNSLRQPEEENDLEIGATTGESEDNSSFSEEDSLNSDLSLENSPSESQEPPPESQKSQNSQRSWYEYWMGKQPLAVETTDVESEAPPTESSITVKPGDILRNVNDNDSRIKYEEIMATHKLTDMKHDKLLIKSHEHFLELIPPSVKEKVNIVGNSNQKDENPNKINIPCNTTRSVVCNDINDPDFLKSHLILETTNDGITEQIVPLTSERSKIISFAKHIFELQKKGYEVKLHICHKGENDFADINNKIYTYSEIKSIEYETKQENASTTADEPNDDDDDEEKTENESGKEKTANEFLDGLNIPSESIFNVDYQYKLWFILNKGVRDSTRVIYLKKARENENDPAGKYSITFSKFREGNGCNIKFLVDEDPDPVVYIPYDERQDSDKNIVDKESPDFFSRFKLQLDPLEHNKTGAFGKFSIKTKITDDDGFMEVVVDKKDNTNKKVRGLIQKYIHENKNKAAAAEAAKKAGGDDLQILSQRSTSTRKYMVYTPSKTIEGSTVEEFIYNNNKEYFVSHDSPTCVRNLLEGQNLILMTGSGKYAVKFELDSTAEQLSDKVNSLINLIKGNTKFYNLKEEYRDDYSIIDRETPIYEYIATMILKYNEKKEEILDMDVYKYKHILDELPSKEGEEFRKDFKSYLEKLFNLHIFYEYYEDINYDSNYQLIGEEIGIYKKWYDGQIEVKDLVLATAQEKSVLKKCKMYLDLQYKMINGVNRLKYIDSENQISNNRTRANKKNFIPGMWHIKKARDSMRGARSGNEEEYEKLSEIDKIIYQKKDTDVPLFLFKFKILPDNIKKEFGEFLDNNLAKLKSLDADNNINMLIALTNLIVFPKPVNTQVLPENLSIDDTSDIDDNDDDDEITGGGNDISLSYNADSFFLKAYKSYKTSSFIPTDEYIKTDAAVGGNNIENFKKKINRLNAIIETIYKGLDETKIIDNPFLKEHVMHAIISLKIIDTIVKKKEENITIYDFLFSLFFLINNDNNTEGKNYLNEILFENSNELTKDFCDKFSLINRNNIGKALCGGYIELSEEEQGQHDEKFLKSMGLWNGLSLKESILKVVKEVSSKKTEDVLKILNNEINNVLEIPGDSKIKKEDLTSYDRDIILLEDILSKVEVFHKNMIELEKKYIEEILKNKYKKGIKNVSEMKRQITDTEDDYEYTGEPQFNKQSVKTPQRAKLRRPPATPERAENLSIDIEAESDDRANTQQISQITDTDEYSQEADPDAAGTPQSAEDRNNDLSEVTNSQMTDDEDSQDMGKVARDAGNEERSQSPTSVFGRARLDGGKKFNKTKKKRKQRVFHTRSMKKVRNTKRKNKTYKRKTRRKKSH